MSQHAYSITFDTEAEPTFERLVDGLDGYWIKVNDVEGYFDSKKAVLESEEGDVIAQVDETVTSVHVF